MGKPPTRQRGRWHKSESPWIAPRAREKSSIGRSPACAAIMSNFLPISQHHLGYTSDTPRIPGRAELQAVEALQDTGPTPISDGQVLTLNAAGGSVWLAGWIDFGRSRTGPA